MSTHNEYTARMHRVLEHIDRHLDGALELSELAAVAHFSAFHFHRVFSAWMGETLGEYLRRRRLEIAATRLTAQPKVPVLDIALSVGFGSSEAFARAFKARFGCTATAWRAAAAQDRNPDQARSKPDQDRGGSELDHGRSNGRFPETQMNVKLLEREPVRVVYLRHVGPYGRPIADFWQQAVYPWLAANGQLGQPRYGISHDDPTITQASRCRYDACVEPSGKLMMPGKAQTTTIPGGQYAAAEFRGTVEQIGGRWNTLLRDWLPMSGMQLDARPFFEHYSKDSSYDAATGIFTCDIMIPVVAM